mgnify:CR=1 FL=1
MIGPVQNTSWSMGSVPTVNQATLVQAEPQAAPAQGSPPLMEQVTDLLESQEAAANAIIQAQITIFKEGLDIQTSMAQQMLKMLESTQLLAAPPSESAINITA